MCVSVRLVQTPRYCVAFIVDDNLDIEKVLQILTRRVRVGDAIGTGGDMSTTERFSALTEFAKRNAKNVDTGYPQLGGGG